MSEVLATRENMQRYADVPGLEMIDPADGIGYSATSGDYWQLRPDEVLRNSDGEALILVRRYEVVEPLTEE